jgi:pimeloyl-ACP methyl ester carboxylesterase
LHTRVVGDGADVLLLHAFPLSSHMWVPQMGALQARMRFIVPDFPGFGLSAASAGAPSLNDYAQKTLAVLDALRIDRVVVVGLSMGGYVAFRLVEQLGARLVGLLLADTRATADTEEAAVARHELAAEAEADGLEVVVQEFLPKLLGETTRDRRRPVVELVRRIISENKPGGVADGLRAMAARPDSTPLLSRIHCPVLCLAGEEDGITPPDVAQAMAERVPAGRAEVIQDAGHLTNLEAPEAFNDALVRLVAECWPG